MPAGAMIGGPYFVGGGDGNDYFAILPPEPALIRAFTLLEEARKEALKYPDPAEARARAAAISLVISQVGTDVQAVAAASAKEAEDIIRTRIKMTQKRKDPPGNKKRLIDVIKCRPLPTVIPGGGVGVGDIKTLDELRGRDGGIYWRAQEFGSDHLVAAGKKLYGYFQPGEAAADPTQFRNHPVFETQRGGPPMTPKRPIPERAFLREGAELADAFRQKELGAAVESGITECQGIIAGTADSLAAIRNVVP